MVSTRVAGDRLPALGRLRPVIEGIRPQVDGGRYPAKAVVGQVVVVEADIFCDGHDMLACDLRYQHESDRRWHTAAMVLLGNDRWQGGFLAGSTGEYRFQLRAGLDRWRTWTRDLAARYAAAQDVTAELAAGAEILDAAAERARAGDRRQLLGLAEALRSAPRGLESDAPRPAAAERGGPEARGAADRRSALTLAEVIFDDALARTVAHYRSPAEAVSSPTYAAVADRERAGFSTWYEMFPRSASPDPTRAGTLADVEARLAYVKELGADVLYLPPIHPIGVTERKGRNGAPRAARGDAGSPWAIGSSDGGHTAVDPALGTIEDFDRLVAAAGKLGIEVAIDLAFQCSPDHPWVTEHPSWFKHRPDGTIRYAENPPKKYQDIYPLDFESEDWEGLWTELLEVVRYWVEHGVTVFRVDNPHTKPFRFWEWLIGAVHAERADVLFLAEAFTRPKVMYELAKLGFSQSYTYFAWRNTKWEIEEYLTELTRGAPADFFRPNFWPNTPDILTEALQGGGTATFLARSILAGTLAANYGVYGPAFELQEHLAREPGSEEYLNSEKYEIRHWELDDPRSLSGFISRLNAVRRAHPALQQDRTLRFHPVDNDALIAYSKTAGIEGPIAGDEADAVVVVVNLDPSYPQSGWVELDVAALGVADGELFVAHDLLTDARYTWTGAKNFVKLDPKAVPAHLFSIEQAHGGVRSGAEAGGHPT